MRLIRYLDSLENATFARVLLFYISLQTLPFAIINFKLIVDLAQAKSLS